MRTVGSRNNKRKIKIAKTLKKRNHRLTDSRVKSKLKPNWIQTGGTYDDKRNQEGWKQYVKETFLQEGDDGTTLLHVLDIMAHCGLYDDTTGLGFNPLTVEDFYDTYVSLIQYISIDEIDDGLISIKEYCARYNEHIVHMMSGNPDISTVHDPMTVNDITSLFSGLQNTLVNIWFMMNIIKNSGQPLPLFYAIAYAIFNFLTKNRYLNDIKNTYAIENASTYIFNSSIVDNPFAAAMVMYYREITKNEDNFDAVEFINKYI